MFELIARHFNKYNSTRDHWPIMRKGKAIGLAWHDLGLWGSWSFLSIDGKTYQTFTSKARLIAYASNVEVQSC